MLVKVVRFCMHVHFSFSVPQRVWLWWCHLAYCAGSVSRAYALFISLYFCHSWHRIESALVSSQPSLPLFFRFSSMVSFSELCCCGLLFPCAYSIWRCWAWIGNCFPYVGLASDSALLRASKVPLDISMLCFLLGCVFAKPYPDLPFHLTLALLYAVDALLSRSCFLVMQGCFA